MIYRNCECGARERWDTGETVHPCQGCTKCGTTFASNPRDHKPLEPHDWKPQFDRDTGKPDRRVCSRCHTRERLPSRETTP